MAIQVHCAACGNTYRVGEDKAGRRLKCKCGQPLDVPALETAKPPAADAPLPAAAPAPVRVAAPSPAIPPSISRAVAPPGRPSPSAASATSIQIENPSPAARHRRKKSPMPLIVTVAAVLVLAAVGVLAGGVYLVIQVAQGGAAANGDRGSKGDSGRTLGSSSSSKSSGGGLSDADYFALLIYTDVDKDVNFSLATSRGINKMRQEHLVTLREKAAARFRSQARFPTHLPHHQPQLSHTVQAELWADHIKTYGAKVRRLLSNAEQAKVQKLFATGKLQRVEMPAQGQFAPF